ncbi:hypothetical protein [Pseudoalteromonas luteoviolacea]|uniref:Uncharacterized protein n=1 Tax=Pseudoalteromonas luteoviolacea (strain 2ta16) TaxID=1353533 RepID=V4HBZ8_PSEL2|nr:hypothetical protein [Pseudoalteromonas luteoviolacea]ESP94986.1 hypothetical protein PL2TA16_04542 [Pseudoalteromonas luteoviolacea 2ta16]KZN36317.1 hypothetical protein N483_22665 [Pseudoalteromonas luteoviolacea NCIMB 1944]
MHIKHIKLLLISLLVLISQPLKSSELGVSTLNQSFDSVSIYALLSNPAKYHNRHVQFVGFLNIEHEGNAVYASKLDFDQMITKNAIWIDVTSKRGEGLSDKYVLIKGTFKADEQGHFGLFSGAIEGVLRLELHKNRKQLEAELKASSK